MKRLGMPVSDDTILRHLKRQVARLRAKTTVRVAGIDDWSWRKGRTYGTIIIDLERREVLDVLADRTTTGTAEWLRQHPEVEIVSRDRCGLYAQGAREGAPQARQVADRFHLLQNLRETIETQLSRADRSTGRALLQEANDEDVTMIADGPGGRREVAEHRHLTRQAHLRSRQAVFDQIHTLRDAGTSIGDIVRQTGFGPRSIRKWLKFSAPPERCATAPKACSSAYPFGVGRSGPVCRTLRALGLHGVEDIVGLERFDRLDESEAAMEAEPFSGVAMPLDVEAVGANPVEASEGRVELLAEIFREAGAVALDESILGAMPFTGDIDGIVELRRPD